MNRKKIIIILIVILNIFMIFPDSYKYELEINQIIKDMSLSYYAFISINKIISLNDQKDNTLIEVINIVNNEKIKIIWDFPILQDFSGLNDKLLFSKAEIYSFGIGDLFEYDLTNNTIKKIYEFYDKNKDGRAKWMFNTDQVVYEKIIRGDEWFPIKSDIYCYNLKTNTERLIKENSIIVDSNNNYLLIASVDIIKDKGTSIKSLFIINKKNEIKEHLLNNEIKDIFNNWTFNNNKIKLYKDNKLIIYGYNRDSGLYIIDLNDNKIYKINTNKYLISNFDYNFESDLIAISYFKKNIFGNASGILIGKIKTVGYVR